MAKAKENRKEKAKEKEKEKEKDRKSGNGNGKFALAVLQMWILWNDKRRNWIDINNSTGNTLSCQTKQNMQWLNFSRGEGDPWLEGRRREQLMPCIYSGLWMVFGD